MKLSVRKSYFRRTAASVALGAVLLSSIVALGAFRRLTARPGEGALRLVPADALVVGTMDLSPSASQTVAFKHIGDALHRNGMDGLVERSLLDIFTSRAPASPSLDALRRLIMLDGLVAALPGDTGGINNARGVAMLAVSNGPAAQALLAKLGMATFYKGIRYYKIGPGQGDKSAFAVMDDMLVIGSEPAALAQVKMVRDGTKPAIATNPKFAAARSHVADDANVMVFVSPELLAQAGSPAVTNASSDWMSTGLAIRDGGIGISCAGVMDTAKEPEYAKLGQIAPIRSDLYSVLPSGAYGAIVISQPTGYFEAIEPSFAKDDKMRKSIGEMKEGLMKSSGLDFDRDVLPAFRGTAIAAAYPVSGASAAGADLLVVLDDSNGADPANAAERLQDFVKMQMEKEGNSQPPMWTSHDANGAHFYRVSGQIESDMRKSMGNGMDPYINKGALVDDKTFAWAVVGKAVLGSSSQELLDRAVETYRSKSANLEGDPRFASSEKEVLDGSQSMVVFSLARVAEGVKNTVYKSKMSPDSRKMFEEILGAFASLDQPLSIHGRMQPDGRVAGGAFIPLDYDRLIDIAGEAQKKH